MRNIVFGMKLILYLIPLGSLLLFSWSRCGRDIWAENTMTRIEGVLTKIENKKYPPSSQIGSSIEVEYSYVYDKKNYVGKNMTFCASFSSGSMIDPFYDMYHELLPKIGTNVTIWVDPLNPENSVLYKYIPRSAILIVCWILLFVFLGLRKLDIFLTNLLRARLKI